MEREEYLKRPLIKGVKYEISNNMVRITDDCSCFIHIERREDKMALQDVTRMFRELKNIAKQTGRIKLKGVTKFLPVVRALYPGYLAASEKISANFSEVVEISKKLKSDGIHMGCNDDELLQAAIAKQNEIGRLHYRNTDYSKFNDYYHTLQRTLREKEWEREDIASITIFLVSR